MIIKNYLIYDIIKYMKKDEIETLLMLLSEDGKELLKRKKGVEDGKVKGITREEVFVE